MRYIIALILMASTAMADMTVFDKSTGNLLSVVITNLIYTTNQVEVIVAPYNEVTNIVDDVQVVTTNAAVKEMRDDVVVTTNSSVIWQKIHPQIRAVSNTLEGQQILHPVDWTVYDVCTFATATADPQTTNDLTGVVAHDVQGQQAKAAKLAQDKLDLRNMGEQGLISMAVAFGITNRPVPMTVFGGAIQSVLATNRVTGQDLVNSYMMYKDFFVSNGGDLWKVGAK